MTIRRLRHRVKIPGVRVVDGSPERFTLSGGSTAQTYDPTERAPPLPTSSLAPVDWSIGEIIGEPEPSIRHPVICVSDL